MFCNTIKVIIGDDHSQFRVCIAFRQALYGQSPKETLISDWPSPLTMISTQINNSHECCKGSVPDLGQKSAD